ncbi:MAG: hypothetical protein Q7T82_03080 [Armatimonadota bacterium]|nr:hypothetical protein [Armatimonadota bacterium]
MARNRLNLSSVRAGLLPRPPKSKTTPRNAADPLEKVTLSRREVLGLAGAVVIGASPGLKAIGATLTGPFELVRQKKRVAFKLDGREVWFLDARRFSGNPQLDVAEGDDRIRVALTGARHPGTHLPADMTMELTRGVVGWRMKLRLALGGFEADVPLDRWLNGAEPACSRIGAEALVCDLGVRGRVTISGPGEAEYGPDGVLRIRGRNIAAVTGIGREIKADSISICPLHPGEPSVMLKPSPMRSLIRLNRGARTWRVDSILPAPDGWSFKSSGSPFDQMVIEAGESRSGSMRQALVAETESDESRLFFQTPHDRLRIPLRKPRYAAAFDANGEQSALIARYGKESTWVHTERCSLELGDSPEAPDFEALGRDGKAVGVACSPALLCIVAPLIGAATQPVTPPAGTTVTIPAGKIIRRPTDGATTTPPATTAPAPTRPAPKPSQPTIRLPKPRETLTKPKPPKISLQLPLSSAVSVIRPQDLLALKFEFINLTLKTSGGPAKLVRTEAGKPACIVVQFPPQHIGEQAIHEDAAGNPRPPDPPVGSRLAGPSRLVFAVPSKTQEIPYTLDALLNWTAYDPSLAPVALPPAQAALSPRVNAVAMERARPGLELAKAYSGPVLVSASGSRPTASTVRPGGVAASRNASASAQLQVQSPIPGLSLRPVIQEPEPHHTAIEAPYRLIISPNMYASWAHSPDAVTSPGGRTELWHTRLGVKGQDGSVYEGDHILKTVRAIWSPDYRPKSPPNANEQGAFLMSLRPWWRHQIVGLTSDFTKSGYEPLPVKAGQLMLSSLGAWMRTRGVWERPEALDPSFGVEEWKHHAAMGRDTFVKVVEKGYLYPFGHRVSKITITERKFQDSPSGKRCAFLRQREFIIVREPVKEYPVMGQTDGARRFPFRRIQIVSLVTPNLDEAKYSELGGLGVEGFWPRVLQSDFQWHVVAEDWEGKLSEFTLPLAYVSQAVAFDGKKIFSVWNAYRGADNADRRTVRLHGQNVAFAPNDQPGDTTLEADSCALDGALTLTASQQQFAELLKANQPLFWPLMVSADVKIAAVQQLVGDSGATTIKYHSAYVNHGLAGDNKGEVFAELVNPVDVSFTGSADKAPGVVTPNIKIGGLSRAFGAIGGDAKNIAGGNFNPSDFFSGAMLLGSVPLDKIVKALNFGGSGQTGDKVPKFVTKPIYEQGKLLPTAVESTLTWATGDIRSWEVFVNNRNGAPCKLSLKAWRRTQLDPAAEPSSHRIEAELKDFTIDLVPSISSLVEIRFKNLKFVTESGKKPDVETDIDKVVFKGALSFINKLEEFLKGAGFSDPPYLDVTSEKIEAGYTLSIPTVAIGVFSLQNISLKAALTLPFIGDPVGFQFDFCEQHNPFILTVSMFGGGGYFGLAMNPRDGITHIGGALEFGGSYSMNLGVASGGVYVMAGISYTYTDGLATLGGYVRCGGNLDVLGLISVSLEFLMSLTHYESPSRMYGVATLTVEIEILFFSTSVDLTVEKEFGGGGDPGFADLMTRSNWNTYCEAFA